MIPRIKSFTTADSFQLLVTFDDGHTVRYDVRDDIRTIPAFKELETEQGLFHQAQLDTSRTCIYWTDQIDLPSDTICEYGTVLDSQYKIKDDHNNLSVAEDEPSYKKPLVH